MITRKTYDAQRLENVETKRKLSETYENAFKRLET